MDIRDEQPDDREAIRRLIDDAFAVAPHASGTEAAIVDVLRAADALTVSLVAVEGRTVLGHVALSPVVIPGTAGSWFGLGPVAVSPDRQRQGVGGALVRAALERLRARAAAGCVVLGDPAYYGRFGFRHDPRLSFADVPPPYFQVLPFGDETPAGAVAYHPAFGPADG